MTSSILVFRRLGNALADGSDPGDYDWYYDGCEDCGRPWDDDGWLNRGYVDVGTLTLCQSCGASVDFIGGECTFCSGWGVIYDEGIWSWDYEFYVVEP